MVIGVDRGRNVPIQDDPGYNSAYFSGLIRKNGIGTLLIFKSGKVNVTGVRSLEQAKRAVEKEFPECESKAIRINKTFSETLPGKIDQSKVQTKKDIEQFIEYTAELFPGINWINGKSRIAIIFFRSGKVIVTGAKSCREAKTVFRALKQRLRELGGVNLPTYKTEKLSTDVNVNSSCKMASAMLDSVSVHYLGKPHKWGGLTLDDDGFYNLCSCEMKVLQPGQRGLFKTNMVLFLPPSMFGVIKPSEEAPFGLCAPTCLLYLQNPPRELFIMVENISADRRTVRPGELQAKLGLARKMSPYLVITTRKEAEALELWFPGKIGKGKSDHDEAIDFSTIRELEPNTNKEVLDETNRSMPIL